MSLRYDHRVIGGGSAARDLRRGRTDRIATAIETVLAQPDLMRRRAEIRRRELLATDAGAARIRIAGGCGAAPSRRQRGKTCGILHFPAAPEDALTAYPYLEKVAT